MNNKTMIKRLALHLVVLCIIVGVAVGIVTWIGDLAEGMENDNRKKEADLAVIMEESERIKGKISRYSQAMPLYEKLHDAKGESRLLLSRDKATVVLQEMKDKYLIDDLKVTINPLSPMTEKGFTGRTMQGVKSSINIKTSFFTDELMLEFIRDLRASMQGTIGVDKITFKWGEEKSLEGKSEDPTVPERAGDTPEVESTIDLAWYGIQPISEEEQKKAQQQIEQTIAPFMMMGAPPQ